MKKEDVAKNLQLAKTQLNKLMVEREDNPALYHTKNKFLPKNGHVHEMETIEDVVKAHTYLLEQTKESSFTKSMERLKVNDSEISEKRTPKVLGYKVSVWERDMETRINEIRMDKKIQQLEKAISVLSKHIDAKAAFEMETDFIDGLLTD